MITVRVTDKHGESKTYEGETFKQEKTVCKLPDGEELKVDDIESMEITCKEPSKKVTVGNLGRKWGR